MEAGFASTWTSKNTEHLTACLAWLRLRLSRLVQQEHPAALDTEPVGDAEVEQATAAMLEAESGEPPPALVHLSRQLGLSRFEQETLLLCAAMELDTRIGQLCALGQGDAHRPYPTFALALALFDEPAWDILSPKQPLRYWQLIEIIQRDGQPLVNSLLRADERIVNYLKGLVYLDDRLAPFVAAGPMLDTKTDLPQSQQCIADEICDYLGRFPSPQDQPVVQLLGIDTTSKQLIARQVAACLNVTLCRIPVSLLPTRLSELEILARLWHRESLLLPLAVYLDASEGEGASLTGAVASPVSRFLGRSGGLTFVDIRDVLPDPGRPATAFDITKPTEVEQRQAWDRALGYASNGASFQLAAQFNLSTPAIEEIAESVLSTPSTRKEGLLEALWQACLVHTRPRLDTLAQRLTPVATWEDIVLPDDKLALLRQIAAQVRQRYTVYDQWGFRQRMNRGLGIVALFAGESGTGKTMAGEVIANDLNLNLYRIDLSAVVSKYIGETEKNLRQLFDAAEDGGAILFFDEADALFGKRSQVRDSHDRYANIEINYLLQRLEAYRGLAILATNMKSALDDAFVRRLRFIVTFPVPEEADRKRMWQRIFPPETPLAELDYDTLARFRMAGGSIHNAAMNAAFLAAEAGTPVTMPLVLDAIRTEFLKSERLLNEEDFLWDG